VGRDRAAPAPLSRLRLRRGRVAILAGADVAALTAALAAAVALAHALLPAAAAPAFPVLAAAALLGSPALFAAYKLYDGPSRTVAGGGTDELGAVFHALLVGSLLLFLAGVAVDALWSVQSASAPETLLFMAAALVTVPAGRAVARGLLLPHVVRARRALVVGTGPAGREIAHAVAAHPRWGLELAGFVDDEPVDVGPGKVLGRTEDLARIVDEHDVEWVLLAFSGTAREAMLETLQAVRRPDVHLAVVPDAYERLAARAALEDLGGIPVISLPPLRRPATRP
jgi:FlaA1/EpsC-like NDP-sugar epimerase